jgi:queuosine precursor transporter
MTNGAIPLSDMNSPADSPKQSGQVRPLELPNSHDDRRAFRYYDILSVLAATVAVCTNMLVLKVARIETPLGAITFGGAVVFFPITYILGDVLTEVYGFRRARRVIWLSFGAQLYAAAMSWAVLAMPTDPAKQLIQDHYKAVFSATPRVFAASLLAFLVGDFVNSIIMARRKVIDRGRAYWKRAILSTVFGQLADSLIFYPLAFAGIWSGDLIARIGITHYLLKVAIEVLGVPFSYWLCVVLKRAEGVDYYDSGTAFNPFGIAIDHKNP